VDEEELAAKTVPVKYNFKEVTEEYPAHAVAGAIAYRLREGKLKLIHRIVDRIGKKPALDLLFETEEIEKNGGQMTNKGDRRKLPGGVFIGLLKQKMPKDDIKYIFTVENELNGTHEYQRKKQQNRDKRKRYNNNKTERGMINALNNALSLDKPAEEKAGVPSLDTITLPSVPKPKTFVTSFVLKEQNKKESFVTLPKGPDEEGIKRMANLKKGYGAFVKKGACDGPVFQPSKTSTLSTESNTFDDLLRTHASTKDDSTQAGSLGIQPEESDEEEMKEEMMPTVDIPAEIKDTTIEESHTTVEAPTVPSVPAPTVPSASAPFVQLTQIAPSRTESLLSKSDLTAESALFSTVEQPIIPLVQPPPPPTEEADSAELPSTEAMSEGELSEGELSETME